jgi:ribonuclease R
MKKKKITTRRRRKKRPVPLEEQPLQLVEGTVSVHAQKGFGFLKMEQGEELFIPKRAIQGAVDGDRVEAEITGATAKGKEGRVVAILQRSRTHLGCTILEKVNPHFVAYAPLLGPQKTVLVQPKKQQKLRPGDRIICRVLNWNNAEEAVEAISERRLGSIDDPSIDILAALEEFDLPDGFTLEARDEARSFGSEVTPDGRVDLTGWECITIDPDTAKDFDDAISLTRDHRGHYHLGVHIADVAAYVKRGSHLDREAALRCNSTYFPGFCLPMLPEELSTELCSLKANVNRLTVSVLAEFTPEGDLVSTSIQRSCIRSRKRFTYKEAYALLQEQKSNPYLPLLERMVQLCVLLKKKRFNRGSIDFALSEGVVRVDAKGVPLGIERVEYDITHQMIEEFMLKANELVAIHLSRQGRQLIFRVHEEPSPETFEDFYSYARVLGFSLPAKPTHRDIQQLFAQAKDSPFSAQLSVSFIRSMKLALYSPENLGHYGLALEHYCHFTSPIRRYSDLIIQRLLFHEEDPQSDLAEIARLCSEKERLSMRAETSVVQLKKLRLIARAFEQDPHKIYTATISRVKPFALFFEVPEFALEGSLHVSELGKEFFEYHPDRLAFRGNRSGMVYRCGSPIAVRLKRVDLIRQQAQWECVSVNTKNP